MKTDEFVRWMLLEAKASREGMPVDPDIESVALYVEKSMRGLSEGFLKIARRRSHEIREFAKE